MCSVISISVPIYIYIYISDCNCLVQTWAAGPLDQCDLSMCQLGTMYVQSHMYMYLIISVLVQTWAAGSRRAALEGNYIHKYIHIYIQTCILCMFSHIYIYIYIYISDYFCSDADMGCKTSLLMCQLGAICVPSYICPYMYLILTVLSCRLGLQDFLMNHDKENNGILQRFVDRYKYTHVCMCVYVCTKRHTLGHDEENNAILQRFVDRHTYMYYECMFVYIYTHIHTNTHTCILYIHEYALIRIDMYIN
jgi:hypothetical protein